MSLNTSGSGLGLWCRGHNRATSRGIYRSSIWMAVAFPADIATRYAVRSSRIHDHHRALAKERRTGESEGQREYRRL